MPLVFGVFAVTLGLGPFWGWRLAMVVAGLACFLMGIAYYALTQDTPRGNFEALRAAGAMPARLRRTTS